MKRFFAVVLSITLLLACLPVIPVSAADETIGSYIKIYKVGSEAEEKLGTRFVSGTCTGKEDDLFDDDIPYDNDLDVFRLKLEKDCTTKEFPHYEDGSVEIDLNGHTWTVTDTGTYELQYGDISISGGTLSFTGGDSHPLYSYSGNINIRNVTFKDCVCGSCGIIYAEGDPGMFTFGQDRDIIPCVVHLDNVTFENCSSTSHGSCVTVDCAEGMDVRFNNCKFIKCHSANGGAIYFEGEGTEYNFINCEFNECYATSDGGAIYCEDDNTTVNFRGCTAYHCNAGGDGGFMFIAGAHTVCNGNGNASASTLADRSNIVGCYALDDGGAIYTSEASGNSNYTEIRNFNMVSNTAGASSHNYNTVQAVDEDTAGGAVYMGGHHMKVSYCDFYDNYADEEGGAIYCGWNNSTIENCSFSENCCEEGNDIYVDSTNNITVRNCTFCTSGNSLGGDTIAHYTGNTSGPAQKSGSAFVNEMIDDGDYVIYSAVASTRMCLDINCDTGGKSDSDNLQLYTTPDAWANVFTITRNANGAYTIKSKYSGLVLDVQGSWTSNGANIYQYKDLGGDNQRWYFEPTGDGYFYIRSGIGTYMDVAGGAANDGTNIYSWEFTGGDNQKFWLQRVMEPGDYVFKTALDTNYAVDIDNGKKSAGVNGANIMLWENGEANVFTVTQNKGVSQHTVKSKVTGLVWDISESSKANGANIMQWTNYNTDNQVWSFEPTGDGYYFIRSGIGTYMDVDGGIASNERNIQSYQFNGTNAQKFRICKASEKTVKNPNGDGSKENPFKIGNAGQWKTFATNVRLGETYAGKYIELTNDISVAYVPVGYFNQKKAFKGHFDGKNHTVHYLDNSEYWDRGLFSYCVGAEIKNVRVTGKIRGTVTLAGICAAAEKTTFENCTNEADISSINDCYIAGICGISSGGKYISCTNNGTIYSPMSQVGGIVARCADGNPEFIDCQNDGYVHSDSAYVGGIVGDSATNVTLKRCVNNAEIKGSACLGGMIGYLEKGADIFSCINTEKGNMNCGSYAAGMIGKVEDSSNTIRINNCANFGKMNVTYGYCAGIVVNFANDKLTAANCFNGRKDLLYIYNCGAITAGAGKGTYTNCYCIDGTVTDVHATTLSAANCKDTLVNKMNTYIRENTTSRERADWLYWSVDAKRGCAEPDLSTYTETLTDGSGTENDPYIISNAKHLEELANDLRHGINHAGKYFKVTQSFSYTGTPIGSAGVDFAGILDGDYHTLTVQIDSGGDGSGLFCAVNGGTVKNLSVAGSIKGASVMGGIAGHPYHGAVIDNCHVTATITGTGTNVGGIAGSTGDCTISNCRVDGNVSTTGWTSVGGIAGSAWGNCRIVNCVCTSTVTGGTAVGGIVGVAMDYDLKVVNCAGIGMIAESTAGGGNKHGGIVGCIAKEVDSIAIINCFSMCNIACKKNSGCIVGSNDGNMAIAYYTETDTKNDPILTDVYVAAGNATAVVGTDVADRLTLKATVRTTSKLSGAATLLNGYAAGKKEGNIPLTAWIYDSANKIVYPNSYSYGAAQIKGSGTERDPYRIANAENLIELANKVSAGETYKGKYFRLTRSFIYDGPQIGMYGKDFCGIFDGYDHKLTVAVNSSSTGAALFAQLGGATVMNLEVAGTVTGTNCVGGIAGYAHNGCLIDNCLVSATVKGSAENCGGIVGMSHNSTITNCRVDGAVTGVNSVGGIAGWFHTSGRIANCLATKKVTGTKNVGGIAGLVQNGDLIIVNCASHADLTVTSGQAGTQFGGIIGGIGASVDSVTIGSCFSKCAKIGAKTNRGYIVGYSEAPASALIAEELHYAATVTGLSACGNAEIAAKVMKDTSTDTINDLISKLTMYAYRQTFEGITLTSWKLDGTRLVPKNYTNMLSFAGSVFGEQSLPVLIVIGVVLVSLIITVAVLFVKKKRSAKKEKTI